MTKQMYEKQLANSAAIEYDRTVWSNVVRWQQEVADYIGATSELGEADAILFTTQTDATSGKPFPSASMTPLVSSVTASSVSGYFFRSCGKRVGRKKLTRRHGTRTLRAADVPHDVRKLPELC